MKEGELKVYFYSLFCFSPNKVQAEVDQIAEEFAAQPNSEESLPEILRRQYPHRPQCRFAGCGK